MFENPSFLRNLKRSKTKTFKSYQKFKSEKINDNGDEEPDALFVQNTLVESFLQKRIMPFELSCRKNGDTFLVGNARHLGSK